MRSLLPVLALAASCRAWFGVNPNTEPDVTPGAAGCEGEGEPVAGGMARTVVILVLDGARIDETFGDGSSDITGEPTVEFLPQLRSQLLPRGALIKPAYATGVTITTEGHAELITGRRQPQANFPNPEGPGAYRTELPTLFELLRAQEGLAEEQQALIVNTVHIEALAYSSYPGLGEPDAAGYQFVAYSDDQPERPIDSDVPVIDAAQQWMDANETRLLLANLHDMDRGGHYGGPTEYTDDVKRVDEPIALFWDWLQTDPRYADNTVLVLVGDHGRHRWGEALDWRNHGDECAGCREIPLFLIGPGVAQGVVIDEPYVQADLTRTVAWLLGVDLPYGTGQLICGALDHIPASDVLSGTYEVAASARLVASVELLPDPAHRAQLSVEAQVLSSDDAIQVEAPRAVSRDDTDVVCWRELALEAGATTWSWQGRCMLRVDGSEWTEIYLPEDEVSPFFQPGLALDDDGGLLLAYADNHTANWEAFDQAMALLRYDGSWAPQGQGNDHVLAPLFPSVASSSAGTWVAFATSTWAEEGSEERDQGRYTRHIELDHVSRSGSWTPSHATPIAIDETDTVGMARAERPALSVDDELVALAWVGQHNEHGNVVGLSTSADGGETWSETLLDDTGLALVHLAPVWFEAEPWWPRLEDGQVSVCSPSGCTSTGYGFINSLAAGDTLLATLSADGTTWDLVDLGARR